jgi:hypothetical protein
MQRPLRAAAEVAMQKIQRVREWEELSENSKRFRECAEQIEKEFHAEQAYRNVLPRDGDADDEMWEDSEDEYHTASSVLGDDDADESFVSKDTASEHSEYKPSPEKPKNADDEECSSSETESAVETDVGTQPDAELAIFNDDGDTDTHASLADTHQFAVSDTEASQASTLL